MILSWLGLADYEGKIGDQEPWLSIAPFEVTAIPLDHAELKQAEGIAEQIRAEADELGDELWNLDNPDSRAFMQRLADQICECVNYTNARMEAIVFCVKVANLGEDPDPSQYMDTLTSGNPQMVMQLTSIFGTGPALSMGYMILKNSIPGPRVLASRLVHMLRELMTPEAILRGYREPGPDPQ